VEMKITITSLRLKSIWHFFKFSLLGMRVLGHLKDSKRVKQRTVGFWRIHYTMTLWNNEEEMREFARTSHHLAGVKRSREIADEIRILTYSGDRLPAWKEAITLLKSKGRLIKY
jgi:hypothetical protein